MKTLYRPGRLGDVVLLGAITASLGSCRIATEARYHPVAARLRGVVEVIEPSSATRTDLIDLQASLRSRWYFPMAPRIRKRSVRRRLWLQIGHPKRPKVIELYARAAGVRLTPPPWIDLPVQERTTLALVPGAAWIPKRPALGALLAAGRVWKGPVVVLGGPEELELCSQLADKLDAEVVCETGFERTFEVLARTRLTVAGDTGLMHLAGACGSQVLAVFGPTHPDDGFFVYAGEVVSKSLPCRPCALHRVPECWRGDLACQAGLEERVRQRVLAVMAK